MLSFKLFLEYYQEEKGSTFSDEGDNYDMNKIFKETENTPVITIKVSDIDWILDGTPISNEDMERIRAISNLTVPILITQKGDKILVVDGFHRLIKAKTEGYPTMLAKWVSSEIMQDAKMVNESMDRSQHKILFVDIDGVMNRIPKEDTSTPVTPMSFDHYLHNPVESDKQRLLHDFVKRENPHVVISSSWKKVINKDQMEERLGFPLHDDWRTPDSKNGFRGDEINGWLNNNHYDPSTTKHAILDDGSDFHPNQPLVRTNEHEGLNSKHLSRISNIFKK